MVSGLAPGREAPTWIVGNSTCGNGATGRKRNARIPASSTPMVSREVPTGRLINGDETLTANLPPPAVPENDGSRNVQNAATAGQTTGKPLGLCKALKAGSRSDRRQL